MKTLQKISEVYHPVNCLEQSYQKIRDVQDAINLPSKSLGEFKRLYGIDFVVSYLKLWLIDLSSSVNVKTKLTESQEAFIAERIYHKYPLKITDITLFFRNIKEGKYGQFYESLSPDKILSWLDKYWNERLEVGAMDSQSQIEGFSLTKDKIDPKVAEMMFKGVEEPEKKSLQETLKETINTAIPDPLENQKGFKIYLEKICKTQSSKELKELIRTWNMRADRRCYVPIFEKELESRKKK